MHDLHACADQYTDSSNAIELSQSCTPCHHHARYCSQATKDGITYNINYSTTMYGYNAITVSYSGPAVPNDRP